MCEVFVLVRNVQSSAEPLDFGEFTIGKVDSRYDEFRKLFGSEDVSREDWILEKRCTGRTESVFKDLEDILLLLRLFRPGDIAFV